ncbi:hypothetical protein [Vibrio coralliirubri]|uniref:hypothetical protein n=1 Tax=Vibrio coralliirubri TaxID=1516159 RepID=UPI000A370DBA|nr:hypothetical protein [Vibrio coralliirubri]
MQTLADSYNREVDLDDDLQRELLMRQNRITGFENQISQFEQDIERMKVGLRTSVGLFEAVKGLQRENDTLTRTNAEMKLKIVSLVEDAKLAKEAKRLKEQSRRTKGENLFLFPTGLDLNS